MQFDTTVNVANIFALFVIGVPLIWKASRLVTQFEFLRGEFTQHVEADREFAAEVTAKLERGSEQFAEITRKLDRVAPQRWDGRTERRRAETA